MVGFLKENISSDPCLFEQSVMIDSCCCNIDIDPADRSISVVDTVDGPDTFLIVVHGITDWVFACFQGKTIMSHILEGNDLFPYFFLR